MQLVCPVCGTETNSSGDQFGSVRAVALHVASSAQSYRWGHREWVSALVSDESDPDIDGASNNDLAKIIKGPVKRFLEYQERLHEEELETQESDLQPHLLHKAFEREAHKYIEIRLKNEYGSEGRDWWYEGVPGGVRQKAQRRKEDEKSQKDPLHFLDLLDLWRILDKQWRLFKDELEPLGEKGDWEERFQRINEARKKIAHPGRFEEVTREEREILEEANRRLSSVTSEWVREAAEPLGSDYDRENGDPSADQIDADRKASSGLEPTPEGGFRPPKEDVVQQLSDLPGVGRLKAGAFYEAGIYSIEEIREYNPEDLSEEVEAVGPKLAEAILDSVDEFLD